MLKLKMIRLRDDAAAGRRHGTSKQSVSQCVKLPTPPAWIMQPPDWQTPLNGIISPSERGWSLCKNNWKEPRSILMSSADRAAYNTGNSCNYCEQCANIRFQREYKCLKLIKPGANPFTNVCWLRFNNIFLRRHKFWLHRQFSLPNSRNEEMMGDEPLVLLLPVCFEQ